MRFSTSWACRPPSASSSQGARAGACLQLQTSPSIARTPPPTPPPPPPAASRSKVFKGPAPLATCEAQPGPHRRQPAVVRVGFDTRKRSNASSSSVFRVGFDTPTPFAHRNGRTRHRLLSASSAGRKRNASHSVTMERRLMVAAAETGTTIVLTWAGLVGELRGV